MTSRNRLRGPHRIAEALRDLCRDRMWRRVVAEKTTDGVVTVRGTCFEGHTVDIDEYGYGICSCGVTLERYPAPKGNR